MLFFVLFLFYYAISVVRVLEVKMVLQAPPSAIPATVGFNSVPTTFFSTEGVSQPTVIILTQSQPQVPPRPPAPLFKNQNSVPKTTSESLQRQVFLKAKMFCCCLCCPAFKCALITATFELIFGLWFWWDAFNHVVKTFDHL